MNSKVAKRVAAATPGPTTLLARIGFASRAAIYLMIGGFAISAAFSGARPRGLLGIIEAIVHSWFGAAIALAIAFGLACFAGWLAVTGFRRSNRSAIGKRWLLGVGMLGDAVLYAGFVIVVLGIAWRGGGGNETALHGWVAWLFANTGGRALVGLVGAGVLGGGIGVLIWGWTRDVEQPLALSPRGKRLTTPISRFGVTGRGAALVLIGLYLLWAAFAADPSKAHGLGGALQQLHATALGWIVLLLFAASFIASAFFDLLEAFYRRVD